MQSLLRRESNSCRFSSDMKITAQYNAKIEYSIIES